MRRLVVMALRLSGFALAAAEKKLRYFTLPYNDHGAIFACYPANEKPRVVQPPNRCSWATGTP
jgi:hypothetical protein